MKINQKGLLIFLICFYCLKGKAQETETYNDAWFFLLNNFQINEKWSAGSEIHWRNTNFLADKQQLILRPFLTFTQNENFNYTMGYSYLRSYPYTETAIPAPKPEHNIWEQVVINQNHKKLSFSHRFRLEHRFQGDLLQTSAGDYEVDGFSFSNRFRYRFTIQRPITEKLFIHVFDELWINMADDFQNPDYDRNWFYAGLGYKIFDNGNVQLGYIHQNIKKSEQLFESHPTLVTTFIYNFDFTRGEDM
ncbi:DUF2490 domain-containing protein [Mesonia aquimarina]|uniref:DUF2490 domain-containing protein n=1 Tax=Mesonia aquimarina TaxID=1504967 RepID=UPI000EF58682|nr:DUF2490 domain-containing protein [Mesonia aquimarina]